MEFPGAFYPVIARGNRRAALFHGDTDCDAYLERLERYRQRDGLWCYAYVLMANHVHLLVETGAVPQYYTRRYQKIGQLLQRHPRPSSRSVSQYSCLTPFRDPLLGRETDELVIDLGKLGLGRPVV